MTNPKTSKSTGRPTGDHGPAVAAIDYICSTPFAPGEAEIFAQGWRDGDLEEWPEYYTWLKVWELEQ